MSDDGEKFRLGEFSARLKSDDIDVVCRALDDYQSAEADTRWGVDNPYRPLDDDVLFAARDLLRRPRSGHSHDSALTIMRHLAEAQDADLIADALEHPEYAAGSTGFDAAGTALAAGEEPNPRLLTLIIAKVLDESLDVRERKEAMHSLDDLDLPEVEDLLVRLTESPDLELQVFAVGCLATSLRLRVHRDRVKRLVESWPEDVGPTVHPTVQWIREALEGFHSIYWKDTDLDDPVLRKAHEELRFPLSDEGCLKAFATLLRSEDPVAVGIALDHHESWKGLRRVLEDEERANAYLPEVLARAREVLRRPMSPAEVSALNMIGARHAEPGDTDLVLDVLQRTDSDTVRKEAIWVAYGVLDEAEEKDERLIEALGDLIFDLSLGETAIRVLAGSLGAGADDILLRALHEGEPRVQAHASYFLVRTGGMERHRAILEEVAESWDDWPPQRAMGEDLDELIFGKPHSVHWEGHRLADPELHRAHKRLRAPGMDESYHQALRTLLESDDQAAVGIAVDHWWSPDGAKKRGGEQAREPERALVLDRIRDMLREPSSPAELSREYGPEAKLLTALAALRVAAEPSLVAEVVENAANDLIRSEALDAAEVVFQDAEEADPRVVEALGNVACDDSVRMNDRVRALNILDESPGNNSVDALVRATRCPEVEVQAAAAWALMWEGIIEDHRAMLEALSAEWPVEDAPWEAQRVREMLDAAKE
ncbi:hypothetical protein LZ318_18870 [Saccharopolyspora indica]|uniref:hypothetical protein n=1 Tax=Saccharopolyspora indica TaxID=1229659 RepID=UPI0022EAC638|nr:hypothetical protein [Saccharopolyspora indica]MDA3645452.1 hypothetical protein [Saccharopolyspora indica]